MKPILFNTEMVRANLARLKTNTRRICKPLIDCNTRVDGVSLDECGFFVSMSSGLLYYADTMCQVTMNDKEIIAPYLPGEILYVRENWAYDSPPTSDGHPVTVYMADYTDKELAELRQKHFRWRPSIHMPKEVARLFLRVTDVWVERLREITNEGVLREGVTPRALKAHGCECVWAFEGWRNEPCANRDAYERLTYSVPFSELWDSTVRPEEMETCSWNANPWVWVIEYEQCEKPEGE